MALREIKNAVTLYDKDGNAVDVTLTNGSYVLTVDAGVETVLTKILRELEDQTNLLRKLNGLRSR
jgi:hypothetical protein